jgi:hypothetical protein
VTRTTAPTESGGMLRRLIKRDEESLRESDRDVRSCLRCAVGWGRNGGVVGDDDMAGRIIQAIRLAAPIQHDQHCGTEQHLYSCERWRRADSYGRLRSESRGRLVSEVTDCGAGRLRMAPSSASRVQRNRGHWIMQ